jgi:predicted nucleic acid-binding protein
LDVTKVFLDTNILIYAVDGTDAVKQELAIKALQGCMDDGSGVISTQVLQEFASVALGKLRQDVEIILAELSVLGALETVQLTPALIRRAVELHALHRVHYWDATILTAAEAARCTRLWSEDFAAGST